MKIYRITKGIPLEKDEYFLWDPLKNRFIPYGTIIIPEMDTQITPPFENPTITKINPDFLKYIQQKPKDKAIEQVEIPTSKICEIIELKKRQTEIQESLDKGIETIFSSS